MNEPRDPLIDEIFRDKVRWARAEEPGRKFMDGIELFEIAVERMRAGVRAQFPDFSAEQVEAEVRRRLDRIRQKDEHGFSRPRCRTCRR